MAAGPVTRTVTSPAYSGRDGAGGEVADVREAGQRGIVVGAGREPDREPMAVLADVRSAGQQGDGRLRERSAMRRPRARHAIREPHADDHPLVVVPRHGHRQERLIAFGARRLAVDRDALHAEAGVQRGKPGEHPKRHAARIGPRHLGAHATVQTSGPGIDRGAQRVARRVGERSLLEERASAG
jgi:hypothetical protein